MSIYVHICICKRCYIKHICIAFIICSNRDTILPGFGQILGLFKGAVHPRLFRPDSSSTKVNQTIGPESIFKASALWADAFYELICPSVCLCVCSLLKYRLNVFLPPLPKVGCPIFLQIQNPWGKKRSGLSREMLCLPYARFF